MRLLLDTHIFLWFISADARLPHSAEEAIRKADNTVFLSVVSVWEVTIKYGLGKLPLPEPPQIYMPRQRKAHLIQSLPVDEDSVAYLASLPNLHRDPFDRMLVCQAKQHGLTLVTVDAAVRAYSMPVLP